MTVSKTVAFEVHTTGQDVLMVAVCQVRRLLRASGGSSRVNQVGTKVRVTLTGEPEPVSMAERAIEACAELNNTVSTRAKRKQKA